MCVYTCVYIHLYTCVNLCMCVFEYSCVITFMDFSIVSYQVTYSTIIHTISTCQFCFCRWNKILSSLLNRVHQQLLFLSVEPKWANIIIRIIGIVVRSLHKRYTTTRESYYLLEDVIYYIAMLHWIFVFVFQCISCDSNPLRSADDIDSLRYVCMITIQITYRKCGKFTGLNFYGRVPQQFFP